ncbi:unnamed protein product [Ceratitis capitata]|uniref:(Mediterranean fruit fly) hypothetical protein n=1 Tax=Ceratitis capitata TaxID=7213 RepID=A0A811UU87_CERCA|nr:unnamed protein product [Ceratitis capitata]
MFDILVTKIFCTILLSQLIHPLLASDIPNCAFQDTVSLIDVQPYIDGSYEYDGVWIPANMTATYTYEELGDGTRIPAPSHVRGCACKLKQCIQLCCAPDERLDETLKTCVKRKLVEYPRIDTYTENLTRSVSDVFEKYIPQQRMPCEDFKILDASLDNDFNILYEDAVLYHVAMEKYISHRDFCLTPYWQNETSLSLSPIQCYNAIPVSTYIYMALLTISAPFLFATIWVYLYVPQLRCLHNSCLVCFLGTFACGSFILSSMLWFKYPLEVCITMGVLCYFFMISAFFWLNITCFDLWFSIRGIRYNLHLGSPKSRFISYSIYVWSAAVIFTLVAVIIEFATDVIDAWKPGFGNGQCFLKSRDWSAMLYFQGPSGLLNFANFLFFALSVINLYQIKGDSYELQKENSQQYKLSTFCRLFLVMGVSWIFEVFMYLYPKEASVIKIIFNTFNASQGIILFIVLVLKRRVLTLLKNRYEGSA